MKKFFVLQAVGLSFALDFVPSRGRHYRHRESRGNPYPAARAQTPRPISWLHVPKAGSSFLNTLYHTPVLCPGIPEDAWLRDASAPGGGPVPELLERYPPDVYCPGSWSTTYTSYDSYLHQPIGSRYAANAGHFVALLRQPEQRLIAQYNFQLANPQWMLNYELGSLRDFAEVFQGCAVKMLARTNPYQAHCLWYESAPPTVDEDDRALLRLQSGFAFVGLTEEWELSVCLFHTMFGGDCKIDELNDMRIGPNRTGKQVPYEIAPLEGFTDVHDGKLYFEAVRIFESTLQHYGVTRPACSCS